MLSSRQSALRPDSPGLGRRRAGRIAVQPFPDVVDVELLRPDQAGDRSPLDQGLVAGQAVRERGVEHVRVGQPGAEDHVGVRERRLADRASQPEPDRLGRPGGQLQDDVRGGLRPGAGGIDGVGTSLDDRRVEGVLHERRRVGRPEEPFRVRVVAGEQPRRLAVDGEPVVAHPPVRREHGPPVPAVRVQADRGLLRVVTPRPGVAVPERRQQVERRRLRPAVRGGDPDDDVLRSGLGVFDDDVEEPVLVEDPRVGQLVFGGVSTAARVLGDQVPVRELALRIAVERLEVRARRRRVEVGVDLLDVLAVVALRAGQPEQPLLEDRVATVPQREREVEPATLVGDAQQAVLAPAVGARPRVVVRLVAPRVAVRRVVLADGAPLAIGEVGTPAPPVRPAVACLHEPPVLGVTRGGTAVEIHGLSSAPRRFVRSSGQPPWRPSGHRPAVVRARSVATSVPRWPASGRANLDPPTVVRMLDRRPILSMEAA